MSASRTFFRRSVFALSLVFGLSACDALLVDPADQPLDLALTLNASAAAGGSAEAFDAADRIGIRIVAGQEVVDEFDLPFDSNGGDVAVPIRASGRVDGVPIIIQVTLRRGADPLFTGQGTLTPDASGNNSAEIELQPVPAAVLIDPPSVLFEAFGERVTFRAAAIFATGDTIDGAAITFRAVSAGVIDVQPNGVAIARAEGTAGVEASFGTVAAEATAEVRQRVVDIEVTNTPTNLAAGASFQLDATLRDANGYTVQGRTVQWTSSDTNILTIDPNGVARAVGNGTVTITGTADDATVSFQVTVATIPVTPSGLVGNAQGTVVSLQWQDNADNETGYQVQWRDVGSTTFTTLTTLPANTTSTSFDTFTEDALRQYVVLACNGTSCSPPSNAVTVATVPATPSSTSTDWGSQYFRVSWSDVRTETYYLLEWDNDGVAWILQEQTSANVTEVFIDTLVDIYAPYNVWRVTACNAAGCSAPTESFWWNSSAKPPRPVGSGVVR